MLIQFERPMNEGRVAINTAEVSLIFPSIEDGTSIVFIKGRDKGVKVKGDSDEVYRRINGDDNSVVPFRSLSPSTED